MPGAGARWRWLAGLVLLCGAALLIVWFGEFGSTTLRRDRVLATAIVTGLGICGLLFWLLLASGLPVGVRLGGGGGLLGALAVFTLGFEVHGLTMDGVPLFARRGEAEAGTGLPAPHGDPWSDLRRRDGGWPGPSRDLQQPRRHWRLDVGAGFAGFAVAGGLAITQEQRGPYECVVAYDLRGREVWAYGDSARFVDLRAGVGPRSTPVVDGDRVYALGATGWLRCLDAGAGGRLLWRRLVCGQVPAWGLWTSPLLVGDLVVTAAPGGLRAFDRQSGRPRWQSDRAAGDAALVLARAAGMDLIVASGGSGASGHDPRTGVVLWRASWPPSEVVAPVAQPLGGGRILLGGGPSGMRVFDVQAHVGAGGLIAALLWRSPHLRPTLSGVVAADGFLYGLDDGRLVCIDAATGFRRWQGARYGHGRLLVTGTHLLVQSEDGDIAFVARDPEAFRERWRFHALDTRRGWAPPTLRGRWLLVRGDGEAALWELPIPADD